MPRPPHSRWKVDAAALFGAEFAHARLSVEVAEPVLIVKANPDGSGKRGALIALDPATGRPLWQSPRTGWDGPCAMSRDDRLACVRIVRDAGAVVNRVSFIDPRSGQDVATATIDTAGWSTITRAGDGFLVVTGEMENIAVPEEVSEDTEMRVALVTSDDIPDQRVRITRFDSHGHLLWTIRPPVNHDQLAVSGTGNLFAMAGRYRGGLAVYRLDTGRALYSTPARPRGADASNLGPDSVIVHRWGFVTSRSTPGRSRVEFFDVDGRKSGDIAGWRVPRQEAFSEQATTAGGDVLPLVSSTDVGMATIRDHVLRWATLAAPSSSVQMLGDEYAAAVREDYSGEFGIRRNWTIFDAHNGARRGTFTTGYGQEYLGFDGTRLLFKGDPAADHRPNHPTLAAYNAQSGHREWRLPSPSTTARWHSTAPYLLLLDDGTPGAGVSSSIARYVP
ncbi:hypothetical protein QSJ19_24545 [Gordonia sp. ABSL11-1]|uniref:PQQ-binding-like beta-propeller repeat protein n=1 Tax=Gordonia sp. ABSL11-1 TaxID=3053924 RepID=UPI0025729A8D|nr:PQQ-binding-like beta-propeller repeat protein [Gordonia sp. ABSL11-1]MDL9948696.1 hypothetical protein [Gordonia sp. ABSL11-1]